MAGFSTNGLPVATQVNGALPLTGTEVAAFDTQLIAGQTFASEALSVGMVASGPCGLATVATGNTVTLAGSLTSGVFPAAAATLAALGIVLSPAYEGIEQRLVIQPVVTALTITSGTNAVGATPTINGAPTAGAGNTSYLFKYRGGAWYRAQ
jgi:hypothetical protein